MADEATIIIDNGQRLSGGSDQFAARIINSNDNEENEEDEAYRLETLPRFPSGGHPSSGTLNAAFREFEKKNGGKDTEAAQVEAAPPKGPPRVSLFDPSIAAKRWTYMRLYGKYVVYLILLMWAFLPIYLAAHTSPNSHVDNLSVWVVDKDGGTVGEAMRQAVQGGLDGAQGLVLGYDFRGTNNASVATDEDLEYAVWDEQTYAILVANEGATSNITSYLSGNNPNYSPTETPAITIWYNEARNLFAADFYVIPLMKPLVSIASGNAANTIISQFISNNTANQTALSHFVQATAQLSTNGAIEGGLVNFAYTNIRPYFATNVAAVTTVGFVLILIFSFLLTMANAAMRAILAPHLTIKSYVLLRIAAPLLAYIPLSLSFATVTLAFHVPWDTKYTEVQGFGLFWITVYLMMCSLGLATEFAIYVVTPKFAPFSMIVLILTNINLVEYPLEMLPGIENYGKAWPFYQGLEIIQTITFNTKSHIRQNIPILVGWALLNVLTISLSTVFLEWRLRRKQV